MQIRNAADVIKKRAITFILDSGMELSAKGVLVPSKLRVDPGRGERSKMFGSSSKRSAQSDVKKER
ncbi:hypothetical protein EBR43_05390 [bacterium]|nr:hypothetical protein [bacterium]